MSTGGGSRTGATGTPFPVDRSGDRGAGAAAALLVAGPVTFITHFMVVYLVGEAGCTGDGPGLEVFDPPVPRIVTLVATALAAVGCALATRWSWGRWRALAGGYGRIDVPAGGPGGTSVVPFAGVLVSAFSGLAVLFVGLPAAFLGC
jgi:hypothetical protein